MSDAQKHIKIEPSCALSFEGRPKIWLYRESIDCRKAVNGLCLLVAEECGCNPGDGSVFVFVNRQKTILKALYYERSGFVLHNKRLTEGHFMVARSAREEALLECLSDQEFKWLLAGLPYRRLKNLPKKYMIYG